jgi:REP element-mobilizing transposase RayT
VNDRLLIAYHLIWTGYGHWLPNDPRGSGSTVVLKNNIAPLGEIHHGRKRVQPPGRAVSDFHEESQKVLRFPVLRFDQADIERIATSFAEIVEDRKYTCYACAIMPDHVHILIRKHRNLGDEMIEHLQDRSRERLSSAGICDPDHPVWTDGGWKRYLFTPEQLRGVIEYIEANPLEIGWPRQVWAFVKPYDRWPLHPGHNPNSPWARGLRKGRCG